jgi:polysaccharide biosynthesis protein PslG
MGDQVLPGCLSTLATRGASAKRLASLLVVACLLLSSLASPSLSFAQAIQQTTDPRLFAQTGFRIDRDAFFDYFSHRGGVVTFGYPVSRDFSFMGCTSQFFQRLIFQQCGTAGVGTMNLLDDGLLPYTRMNGSTFPAADLLLTSSAPRVGDPTYGAAILDYVRKNTVDTFDGAAVGFQATFFKTVTAEMAGTDDPNLLGLLDLEIWGAPTSKPAYDPANRNFIYQRFQRGIMHYDKTCGCTQGLLLADYLKSLLTGDNLPADLAAQAATSPLLRSAVNGKPPFGTGFGNAFVKGAGSATVGAPPDLALLPPPPTGAGAALTNPSGKINSPPTPVPSPDYGLSMFLWEQPTTTERDLKIASGANFHWQKTLFQWRAIEGKAKGVYDWSEADRIVKASAQHGVKIIARIDFQPAWARKDGANNGPPDDYQDYADFVAAFASRYRPGSPVGAVDAIEIWNEVNLNREWGMRPINRQQAADYVRLLTLAYNAAHAAQPNVIIITAGLSPTGVKTDAAWDDAEYLQWLFDAGLKGGVNYDVLGAHGNTQAPEVEAAFNSLPAFGHPSFYFRRVEQLRDVQVRAGDANRQIWLLEFGWTADKIHPNYAWFAVSEDKKAENILKAFQYARKNWAPWIGVMTVWTLSDPTWTPEREEYWWAIANPDGTARAALIALRTARIDGQL